MERIITRVASRVLTRGYVLVGSGVLAAAGFWYAISPIQRGSVDDSRSAAHVLDRAAGARPACLPAVQSNSSRTASGWAASPSEGAQAPNAIDTRDVRIARSQSGRLHQGSA
jgi:hypothetical protein